MRHPTDDEPLVTKLSVHVTMGQLNRLFEFIRPEREYRAQSLEELARELEQTTWYEEGCPSSRVWFNEDDGLVYQTISGRWLTITEHSGDYLLEVEFGEEGSHWFADGILRTLFGYRE